MNENVVMKGTSEALAGGNLPLALPGNRLFNRLRYHSINSSMAALMTDSAFGISDFLRDIVLSSIIEISSTFKRETPSIFCKAGSTFLGTERSSIKCDFRMVKSEGKRV